MVDSGELLMRDLDHGFIIDSDYGSKFMYTLFL